MTQTTDIWNLIEPYLAAENIELDDLELSGRGRGRTLRVTVDGAEVDVDRLAEVSRGLGRLLDAEPSLQDEYQLEVSTPGLARKLRRPTHYKKSVGREVVIRANGDATTTTHRGVLSDAGDSGFTVDSDDGSVEVLYADVVGAKTVFRWEKSPKPGH